MGDGKVIYGKNVENLYTIPSLYNVQLTVTDGSDSTARANTSLRLNDGDSCESDSDGDQVVDCRDSCPLLN